jgi:hypothetical protein
MEHVRSIEIITFGLIFVLFHISMCSTIWNLQVFIIGAIIILLNDGSWYSGRWYMIWHPTVPPRLPSWEE